MDDRIKAAIKAVDEALGGLSAMDKLGVLDAIGSHVEGIEFALYEEDGEAE